MPSCLICYRKFATHRALDQHLDSPAHRPSYYCGTCDRGFRNQHALNQHFDSPAHRPQYFCSPCSRYFWTANALNQHWENSAAHRRTECIGVGCWRTFRSWSAMMQHWESGACRAGITRSLVNRFAASLDPAHMFSVGGGQLELPPVEERRMVEVDDNEPEDLEISGGDAGVPSAASISVASSVTVLTPATVTILTPATEPSAFQTPGSISNTPIFTPRTPLPELMTGGVNPSTLIDRLQKLTPRIIEIPPIYFCPVPECTGNANGKTFTSLSGLFQHMERGCRGSPRKFRQHLIRQFRYLN
ncbi:hypothetical protein EV426DRAFT_190381 [Tirmania nivea]|nr:hypothetical protein EV426DRAFT_190381 [Tirmania nivea]